MAKRSWFDSLVSLLLLAAVIFFGIAAVNALDRNRREIAKLRQAVSELSKRSNLNAVPAVLPQAAVDFNGNAEFFDRSAVVGGTLRSAITSDVGSLNPVTSNEATAARILSLCTSVLGTRNLERPEEFVPMIAESWTASADNRRFTVKLRKGVLWQSFTDPESGKFVPEQPVTAHDFVFYVDTIRNPEVNAGALRSYFQDLESIEAVNDHELLLVWKNPYFRSLELTLGLMPLPRHFYCPGGAEFNAAKFNDDYKRNDMIVGCGPYRLVEHVRDQRFVLERFENYFGKALGVAPAIEKRVLEIVKADNTRFQMLMSGELDELGLSAEQWTNRAGALPFSAKVLTSGEKAVDFPLGKGETLRRVKYLSQAYFMK